MSISPGTVETFNARGREPAEVATTFVPPPQFRRLLRGNHTLLVGPRGSGKTTLLKMLDDDALSAWQHEDAARARTDISFIAVFIPADRLWREDFLRLTRPLEPRFADALGYATFVTQSLRALLRVADRRSRSLGAEGIERSAEGRIAMRLASHLSLDIAVPSMAGLVSSLSDRLFHIGRMSRRSALTASDGVVGLDDPALELPLFETVSYVLDVLQETWPTCPRSWSFVFDELELAPQTVISELLQGLRSVDSRIVLKLGLSPNAPCLEEIGSLFNAMPNEDYELVDVVMGGGDKEEALPFSTDLVASVLRRRGWPMSRLEDVFGESMLARTSEKRRGAYRPGSQNVARMRDLAQLDPSYAAYLRKRNLDLSKLDELPDNVRAESVRKSLAVVAVRLEYLKERRQHSSVRRVQRVKSRRSASAYTGIPALMMLCEGNPRWLVGMVTRMLDRAEAQGSNGHRLTPAVQNAEIVRMVGVFRAFLRSVPVSEGQDWGRHGIIDLADRVGTRFRTEVLGDSFKPDPVLSFKVDDLVDDQLAGLVRAAVAAGAVVALGESIGSASLGNVRGGRFRLTHLLAPAFLLPLVSGREMNLSSVLAGSARQARSAAGQQDLFAFLDEHSAEARQWDLEEG